MRISARARPTRARGSTYGGGKMRSMSAQNPESISRRTMLGTLGVLGAAAATGVVTVGAPARAVAQQFGQQESVQDALKRLFGTRPMKDGSALVKLDIPLIAENGAVVPVNVDVQSPMTP